MDLNSVVSSLPIRAILGPAPPFEAPLADRLRYGIARSVAITVVLTVVLGVGLIAGAGAEIAEAGTTPSFLIQLYLVVGLSGSILFYALRPLHRRTAYLVGTSILTMTFVVTVALLMMDNSFGGSIPFRFIIAIAGVTGAITGVGLAYLQRHNDVRYGLYQADA
jgi:hypothetical protein